MKEIIEKFGKKFGTFSRESFARKVGSDDIPTRLYIERLTNYHRLKLEPLLRERHKIIKEIKVALGLGSYAPYGIDSPSSRADIENPTLHAIKEIESMRRRKSD